MIQQPSAPAQCLHPRALRLAPAYPHPPLLACRHPRGPRLRPLHGARPRLSLEPDPSLVRHLRIEIDDGDDAHYSVLPLLHHFPAPQEFLLASGRYISRRRGYPRRAGTESGSLVRELLECQLLSAASLFVSAVPHLTSDRFTLSVAIVAGQLSKAHAWFFLIFAGLRSDSVTPRTPSGRAPDARSSRGILKTCLSDELERLTHILIGWGFRHRATNRTECRPAFISWPSAHRLRLRSHVRRYTGGTHWVIRRLYPPCLDIILKLGIPSDPTCPLQAAVVCFTSVSLGIATGPRSWFSCSRGCLFCVADIADLLLLIFSFEGLCPSAKIALDQESCDLRKTSTIQQPASGMVSRSDVLARTRRVILDRDNCTCTHSASRLVPHLSLHQIAYGCRSAREHTKKKGNCQPRLLLPQDPPGRRFYLEPKPRVFVWPQNAELGHSRAIGSRLMRNERIHN